MRPLLFCEAALLDASNYTHDRHPHLIAGCPYSFADGITGRPVVTCEWFVDDGDWRRVAVIGRLKVASLQKRNAQRSKRPRRYTLQLRLLGLRAARTLSRLLSFNNESIDLAGISKRQVGS